MLKKIGIAVACGIAVYGLLKLVSRHVVHAPDPSVLAASEAAVETNLPEANSHREHVKQDVSTAAEGTVELEPSVVGVDAVVVKPLDCAGEASCA